MKSEHAPARKRIGSPEGHGVNKRGRVDDTGAFLSRSPSSRPQSISLSGSQSNASNHPGSSCHQCKSRRGHNDLLYCTNVADKKSKGCRKKYCEHCLRKFYKEDFHSADRNNWSCPSCRKICCCAACRRKEQKERGGGIGMDDQGTAAVSFNLPSYASSFNYQQPLANYNSGNDAQSSFALLYAVAQMPGVQKLINEILNRKDLSDSDKVESIAALLRGAVSSNPRMSEEDASDSDAE